MIPRELPWTPQARHRQVFAGLCMRILDGTMPAFAAGQLGEPLDAPEYLPVGSCVQAFGEPRIEFVHRDPF